MFRIVSIAICIRSLAPILLAAIAIGLPALGPTVAAVAAQDDAPESAARRDAFRVHPQIRLFSPVPGADVTSPVQVAGEARGTWYFEGSFPIRLLNESGTEIGTAIAQAQAPWMTEEFVPFEAELAFDAPPEACLELVLERANPSGLPEHDDEVRVGLRCALEK